MKICMNELIRSVAVALDMVECELLGASTNHGKRVAVLCALMGKKLGMTEEEIRAVATCALFHDNALTEYVLYMQEGADWESHFKLHCEYGQRNIEMLPFKSDISGLILYHHEQADGGGLFGKKEGEFPLGAELIAIADTFDVKHHLQRPPSERLSLLKDEIRSETGKLYTQTAAKAMLAVLNENTLLSLRDENISGTIAQILPEWEVDIENEACMRLANLTANIIDNKSPFTRKHSVQIANRAWIMGGYYGFEPTMRVKMYLAAALHDIGKLATPNEILDKPGKLNDSEFQTIKDHVKVTYDILSEITGFEEICRWASSHHEKLDGTGYYFGKNADNLDFISRILVCTDIYQAICEERPYHPARSHADTMEIMYDMAQMGFIDSKIVKDFDIAMAPYSNKDVPSPNSSDESIAGVTGATLSDAGASQHVKPTPKNPQQRGWRCKVCAYVFPGDDLPPDFICPVCHSGANDFTKMSGIKGEQIH